MKKVVDDGYVAVLHTRAYGAGWSTWNREFPEMLFDPDIVDVVLKTEDTNLDVERIRTMATQKYPNGYFGGANTLTVTWVKEGTEFFIKEYDGRESIVTKDSISWIVA